MRLSAFLALAFLLSGCVQESKVLQNDSASNSAVPVLNRTCVQPYPVEEWRTAEVPYAVNETYLVAEKFNRTALLYGRAQEVRNLSVTRFIQKTGEDSCVPELVLYNPNNFELYFNMTFTTLTLPAPGEKMQFTANNSLAEQYIGPFGVKQIAGAVWLPQEYRGPYTCSIMPESVEVFICEELGVHWGTLEEERQVERVREVIRYRNETVLVNTTKYRNVTC